MLDLTMKREGRMGNFWGRMDRIAREMSDSEKEQRDASRASWVDASQIAVLPTLDPDTIAARKERARQVRYQLIREARQGDQKKHSPVSKARDAYHCLREGGTV
jgi:hypothetical protein